ncbi:MAG: PLP-dependent aminotransferase family protein [Bryobacterales bacterium]|nr:PLP-dependent aminotransferase family protein [Bryobacterales bacterium]
MTRPIWYAWLTEVFRDFHLDPVSPVPLYRQVFDRFSHLIHSGELAHGDRLPATRDLAAQLGLNRGTVAAAYALLESEGLISGHVGRGSFVLGPKPSAGLSWSSLLAAWDGAGPAAPPPPASDVISFESSRPAGEMFPLDEFAETCGEVTRGADRAAVLQLGSPFGFGPLRQWLIEEMRRSGAWRDGDDLIVTSGCQQALDLLVRVLMGTPEGATVALEDPVYPGARNLFARAGVRMAGVPVGPDGLDLAALERVLAQERPRIALVTPNFQNPTGLTLPLPARRDLIAMARNAGCVLVENDVYGDLRYWGEPEPSLKALDDGALTVQIRSFSKVAFPGLRVGWAAGPRPLIARMAEAKLLADLHTDHLSQAVLLRFAESGRLAAHIARVLNVGRERLEAVLDACAKHLPDGASWTRPEGGMNLWVNLPRPLDAAALLPAARRAGVSYLPGHCFAVSRQEPGGFRLSFAGLEPEQIHRGVGLLGAVCAEEFSRERHDETAPAIV